MFKHLYLTFVSPVYSTFNYDRFEFEVIIIHDYKKKIHLKFCLQV